MWTLQFPVLIKCEHSSWEEFQQIGLEEESARRIFHSSQQVYWYLTPASRCLRYLVPHFIFPLQPAGISPHSSQQVYWHLIPASRYLTSHPFQPSGILVPSSRYLTSQPFQPADILVPGSRYRQAGSSVFVVWLINPRREGLSKQVPHLIHPSK